MTSTWKLEDLFDVFIPISFRIASLALGQPYDFPSTTKDALKYVEKTIGVYTTTNMTKHKQCAYLVGCICIFCYIYISGQAEHRLPSHRLHKKYGDAFRHRWEHVSFKQNTVYPYTSVSSVHLYSGKADSRFAPSQWQTAFLCNDVSHWLGASLESSLQRYGWNWPAGKYNATH